jgi:phosphoenolpyruvate carboxykinase (ATP)
MAIETLKKLGLNSNKTFQINKETPFLVEQTLKSGFGVLSNAGALMVKTGTHTGRSAKDKYLVKDAVTSETIDWSHDLIEMTPETFTKIKSWAIETLNAYNGDIYVSQRSAGAVSKYNVPATLVTTGPSHNLFFNNMFRPFDPKHGLEGFTIIHLPFNQIDATKFNLRSNTCITTNFSTREVIVIGTAYAGEVKKSIFSILNYILPEKGVLPMHSGANLSKDKKVSVFFGLSGTGKTTLSTDEGFDLIGDDEHGLSDEGIFNFEGGCYAKTYKLKFESEPDIYKACHKFGTLLENVTYDENTRAVNFDDKTLTENGRASYALDAINNFVADSKGPVPSDLFFLSADAFGVLPPVAKLNANQAMYYFLSGYTAKLAGTEIGVTEPVAAFSTCFGGPFMMRHPQDYAKLLGQYMKKYNINVWLINTGWTGGGYGVGERFPIKVTRQILRSIQAGNAKNIQYDVDPFFGLSMPKEMNGIESYYLNPKNTWKDKAQYDVKAKELAMKFHKNFEKYSKMEKEILLGGPSFKG